MKSCLYCGTFDPPTLGHLAVIEDASKIFDEVVVAVIPNTAKNPLFSLQERVYLLQKMCEDLPVRVVTSSKCACDLLREIGTPFYVRGVRDSLDFAYETRDFYATKILDSSVIEIYLPARQELLEVSSTLVKNSIYFQKPYEHLVSLKIYGEIKNFLEKKNV